MPRACRLMSIPLISWSSTAPCRAFSKASPTSISTMLPTGCGTTNQVNGFYNCPFGLGNVNKTIGSSRQIQMMLRLTF
jgi:hypothetical protein